MRQARGLGAGSSMAIPKPLALAIAAFVLLSGCAAKHTPPGTSSSSSHPAGHASATSSGSAPQQTSSSPSASSAPANRPPTITAFSAQLGNASQNATLTVAFTFAAADPDHDALAWSLAAGDNATRLAGTGDQAPPNHTHPAPGHHH